METAFYIVVGIVVGLGLIFIVNLVRYSIVTTGIPACNGCDVPIPHGYYATSKGKQYCQRCAEELNLLPWWLQ